MRTNLVDMYFLRGAEKI